MDPKTSSGVLGAPAAGGAAALRLRGRESATGARYLEEVAFEVVNASRADVTERAEDLSARGVRRVFGVIAALALVGCGGTAVLITRSPEGGVLGLDGDHDEAMADARRQMSDACGGAYTILGERNTLAAVYRGRTIMEYQIRYACGAQPERPGGGPVPGAH